MPSSPPACPLRCYSSTPGLIRDTLAIRNQLAVAEGVVGYSLNTKPARKTFWSFSVWFERGGPMPSRRPIIIAQIIRRLAGRVGST
jgi:hypothetical protein